MVPTIYLGLESQGLYTVRDKLQEMTNVNRQKKKVSKWWELVQNGRSRQRGSCWDWLVVTVLPPEGFRNQPQTDRSSAQWENDTNHCLRQFIQSSDLQSRTSSNPFPVTQNSNKNVSWKGTNSVTWHDRIITRAQSAFICANKALSSLSLCFWSSIHEAALTLVIIQWNLFR